MSVPAAYIGVILIWSTTPLAIKWSGSGDDFLFGLAARMLIGVMLTSLLMLLLSRRLRRDVQAVKTYLATGLGIYGAMVCVYWGAQFINSGLISVLYGMTPLMTGLMAAVWLNERSLTPLRVIAILLAIGGLCVIFADSFRLQEKAVYGVIALTISVFIHSLFSVLVKKMGSHLGAMEMTHGGLLVAVPLLLLTWFAMGYGWPQQLGLQAVSAIIYLGIVGSVMGFMLFFYVLKHIEAARVALITLITPVLALYLGHWLNNEQLNPMILSGTALIMSGMSLYQWGHLWLNRRTA